MTISPPSNTSYGKNNSMSPQESARERENTLRSEAFFRTPEGQAAQAELLERSRQQVAHYEEFFASMETRAKEDKGAAKHNEHGKLFGRLLGLMTKMTKKG